MNRSSVLLALAVLLLASLAAAPSEAQQPPPSDAACFGFVLNELAGKDRHPRPNLLEASSEYMSPLVEEWMESQLAAGKTQFVANQMGPSGSVLCAW